MHLLDQLLRGRQLFLRNTIGRGGKIALGARHGARLNQARIALEFDFRVCEFRRGRALLRFPPQLLF
jgi:hypothetical protein